jgi:hypothetical protein
MCNGSRTLVVFMKPDMWQAIDGDTLRVLSASSIRTRHNRIYLEDGRELVIQLETAG